MAYIRCWAAQYFMLLLLLLLLMMMAMMMLIDGVIDMCVLSRRTVDCGCRTVARQLRQNLRGQHGTLNF